MEPFIAFLIFAGLLVLETWASAAWLPLYYRFGIPISVNHTRISVLSLNPGELARALETRLQAQPGVEQGGRLVHPTLQFRQLPAPSGAESNAWLAFRERLFEDRPGGRYLPVMHSTVRLSRSEASTVRLSRSEHLSLAEASPGADVTVTGRLNWTILYILGYLIYRGAQDARYVPVALLILVVLLLSFAAQNSVNGRVAQQIATAAPSVNAERGSGRE